ncbi:type IV pilus modification protein PilV [Massilia endophytica]|uniref:type IV pilus modification protein PilV n=1 Tax=Massilia endophytica TaxID=2899220 RepID=UPI001E2A86EC|nr:type IV pilus modification protein PilV [Massilia endophytica]UGQ47790.1 type IV pilus modification protein PilV [Massilia endophytica]
MLRASQAGFTLLEVLIAVLVLALGMVGGLAMQLHALRARHESALLSNATQLAAGALERLRANPGQQASYLTLDFDAASEPSPASSAACFARACSAAELAAMDIADIKRLAASMLPLARIRLCRDRMGWQGGRWRWPCSGESDAPIVVKVGWRMRQPAGAAAGGAGREHPVLAMPLGSLP